MEIPKYIVFRVDVMKKGTSVELINITDDVEDVILKAEQTEPKWTKENCKGCKYNEYPYDSGTCFVRVCINGNKYEPKE